jgi:hypothetical protein
LNLLETELKCDWNFNVLEIERRRHCSRGWTENSASVLSWTALVLFLQIRIFSLCALHSLYHITTSQLMMPFVKKIHELMTSQEVHAWWTYCSVLMYHKLSKNPKWRKVDLYYKQIDPYPSLQSFWIPSHRQEQGSQPYWSI